jgi:hypothetical protein
MTIEQPNIIDFFSVEHGSGDVVLTISDHLVWDRNEGEHLILLQTKLNKYLHFIESGEIYERYPQVEGKNVVINLVSKYPLSEQASLFFKKASAAIGEAGFSLQLELPDSK